MPEGLPRRLPIKAYALTVQNHPVISFGEAQIVGEIRRSIDTFVPLLERARRGLVKRVREGRTMIPFTVEIVKLPLDGGRR